MGLEVKLTCDKCGCEMEISSSLNRLSEQLVDITYGKLAHYDKIVCPDCQKKWDIFHESKRPKEKELIKEFFSEQSRTIV